MSWSEKYKQSIDCNNPKGFSQRAHCQGRKKKMEESNQNKDHEISMAKTQVKNSIDNLKKVARILAKKSDADNLPAWVQAKLTDTEHNTYAAASYVGEATDGIKAKDYKGRLDKWFDNGGWVQTGGKYDGKPCAKQPGQTTKPYCRDPDDRASMDKNERNRRAAKKRREDPNPNRSGKAIIVTQEAAGEKDACYHKVKRRYKVWPSAYASGALVKCRKVGADSWGNTSEEVKPIETQFDRLVNAAMSARNPKTRINILKYASSVHPTKVVKTAEEVQVFIEKLKCWKGCRRVPGTVAGTKGSCTCEDVTNEDWQKVNRQDKTDGLSPAAVNAYRRENPGSKLQTAVTEKSPKGKRAKRRASFCRRMRGMRNKLTSAETARDPDSRINKALRRWRCR